MKECIPICRKQHTALTSVLYYNYKTLQEQYLIFISLHYKSNKKSAFIK